MWQTLTGDDVPDIAAAVRALCAGGGKAIHIGTDSKQRALSADYVTVIAVLDPGFGGRILYRRERAPRSRSLAEKLFREVALSLEAAGLLQQQGLEAVTVHVDANGDSKHESSRFVGALSGMVVGHGFHVRIKPEAWCATHVADSIAKDEMHRAA
ncbi:MAG: hypothetical protein FJ299_06765 [Planctomycetes bacterium]|nr:hypothetical protein [Planctomycetota bacterium]